MVHSNNGTTDLNAWVNIFKEFAEAFGMKVDMNDLFGTLYNKALEGDADCGGLMSYTSSQENQLLDLMKDVRYLFVCQTANSILQTL